MILKRKCQFLKSDFLGGLRFFLCPIKIQCFSKIFWYRQLNKSFCYFCVLCFKAIIVRLIIVKYFFKNPRIIILFFSVFQYIITDAVSTLLAIVTMFLLLRLECTQILKEAETLWNQPAAR